MTSKVITNHMQAIFAKYRWPDTLVTDIGPSYTRKEFQMPMQPMSVNHITSSPHYPQSNRLAEKFVGIIKNLSHKAKEESQSPYTTVMVYRNTPSMELYSHQCKFYKLDKLILTTIVTCCQSENGYQTMHPDQLLKFFMQRINHYLLPHMIYPLVRMSCTGNLVIEDGIPQL